jgi:C-terminal processing protease CtpA/Prc
MQLVRRVGTLSKTNSLRKGWQHWLLYTALAVLVTSCAASKGYYPESKIPPAVLKQDFQFFRNVLEESHPSLYWFEQKDSIDGYFNRVQTGLTDSLTEREFRTRLNYVLAKIRCGHTVSTYSKRYSNFLDTANLPLFPINMKCWKDTLVVTSTLSRKSTPLTRGTVIRAINGIPAPKLIDTFFNFINGDGFSDQGRYQYLSNRGNFGTLYKNVLGLSPYFRFEYIDSTGLTQYTTLPVFDPSEDSTEEFQRRMIMRETREDQRSLEIDTALSSGYMTVNTFSRGNGIPKFFKRSFKTLRKNNIRYLVLDVRSNGGGDAGNSTMLTRYIADKPFKIADSLYAIRRSSKYSAYIKWQPMYWLMMTMVTHKKKDNRFHFGYFERHYFTPKKQNHFDGEVYIITGGNSFSATTLFAQKLKGQRNVRLVGEETGGGSYGNTAWMMPEVTLPKTRIRFRLPKFRLVMDKELVKEGRGVMPDIPASPSVEDIRKGVDVKADMVHRIILNKRSNTAKTMQR